MPDAGPILPELDAAALARLEALGRQVRADLERIAHPTLRWMPERFTPDGRRVLDVLVAGAGQGGLAVAFQLLREKVDNILVIDRAPEGQEGAWVTYARMHTLRSPKDYTGPDLDIPSLTYRSWHEAAFGAESWAALGLIAKEHWAAYLAWYRSTIGIPARNRTALVGIEPADGHLRAIIETADGREALPVRKIVLATGQDGTGRWWMPDFVEALPARFRAHTGDPIDFERLSGKRVAVLGAGASAADNAAVALEHGAAEVVMFCRRPELQRVQPYRWLTFAGFMRHAGDLPDEWRWRFMAHILGLREGIPPDTWQRLIAHRAFRLATGVAWTGARAEGGAVRLATTAGDHMADFLICGAGIEVDFARRPELAAFADKIATWAERYAPPPEKANPRLARYPYLGPDFAFTEREPGAAPFLRDIHDFTFGATMSLGPSGCSINAMKIAVPKLVAGVTRGLFAADLEHHWRSLRAYRTVMFEMPGDAG